MSEDIKQKIGRRIAQARKEHLGITIKELAARTEGLSASRISNWEQGTRSPGPLEAIELSRLLKVSSSYLLGLTDNPSGDIALSGEGEQFLIPLLSFENVHLAKDIIADDKKSAETILIDSSINKHVTKHCVALLISDNSMAPEFHLHDMIIVNTEIKPKPGNFVLAHHIAKNENLLRQYSQSSTSDYRLTSTNDLWADINVKKSSDVPIIGTVVEHRRYFA